MKLLIRLIARMYPRRWRDRYAAELEALLADSNAGWRDAPDLLKGAVLMHARMAGGPARVALFCAAGLALGYSLSYVLPPVYWSESRFRLESSNQHLFATAQRAFARKSLVAIIDDVDLYADERKRLPMEDIVEQMRRDIRVTSLLNHEFRVSYRSGEEHKSRLVVERLMRSLAEEAGTATLTVVDYTDPQATRPYQRELPLAGAAAGAAGAAIWTTWRRRPRAGYFKTRP